MCINQLVLATEHCVNLPSGEGGMKGFLQTCQFAISFETSPSWEAPLDTFPSLSSLSLVTTLLAEEFIIASSIEMQTPRGQGLFVPCSSPHREEYLADHRCSIGAQTSVSTELTTLPWGSLLSSPSLVHTIIFLNLVIM